MDRNSTCTALQCANCACNFPYLAILVLVTSTINFVYRSSVLPICIILILATDIDPCFTVKISFLCSLVYDVIPNCLFQNYCYRQPSHPGDESLQRTKFEVQHVLKVCVRLIYLNHRRSFCLPNIRQISLNCHKLFLNMITE